jgi:hypothetical protein
VTERLGRAAVLALLATLGGLVLLNVPELGSDAWPFRPRSVEPEGILGPLVRAAGEHWDHGFVRTPGILAGLLVALAAGWAAWRPRAWPAWAAGVVAVAVLLMLLVPGVVLQAGLRQATDPWLHVNDSTYQIELGGEFALDGDNPYGHDYRGSGLERWYPAAGSRLERQVALEHFAYFPGTVLTAAAWRLLPAPFDDYRFLVLLATLALPFAALLFPAPLEWRLALGAVLAANPLAVRAAWFGTADAPSLLLTVLAFAFVARGRHLAGAASLAGAVLLKQFALVALPFLAAMLVARRVDGRTLWRAAALFVAVVAAGILPFAVADPGALWEDTIAYGGSTYRIIGYGVAGMLVEAGVIDDRFDPYPFVPLVLLVWVPLTAWLAWTSRREPWQPPAGFAVSIFVLFFLSRVFQNSYLVWPLAGIVLAVLLAAGDRLRSLRTVSE